MESPQRESHRQSATADDLDLFRIDGLGSVLFGFRAKRSFLTKSERAYADVRRAVVTHALPSGVPLDESLLLDHFPVGRTPLREALKRLSYEGLLIWPPHQAPAIRDIGLFELQSLYETRRLLEYQVAIAAAERANDDDIQQMDMISRKLTEASKAGYVYEAVELDFALHSAIAYATQNRFLVEANNNLNLQSLRLWYRAQRDLGLSNVDKLHNELVHAIRLHDADAARELAEAHIDKSIERQQLLLTKHAPSLAR